MDFTYYITLFDNHPIVNDPWSLSNSFTRSYKFTTLEFSPYIESTYKKKGMKSFTNSSLHDLEEIYSGALNLGKIIQDCLNKNLFR